MNEAPAEVAALAAPVNGLKPYYQDEWATIYHGDNRTILPHLGPFSLLLTDPPYGIGESSKKAASRGRIHGGGVPLVKDYGTHDWDEKPVDRWVMELARSLCRNQVIFGGNYYNLPPSPCWLVWDKENSGDFADGELAWTNLSKAVRIRRHLWNGMIRKGQEERFHPTQKPLEIMAWALSLVPDVTTVLDPWMGSGTTLRACKDARKISVGIEMNERDCETAARRLSQEVLALEGGTK